MRGDSFITLVAAEDDSDAMNKQEGTEETHSSQDAELAKEIGLNAHEYLEECFYNEVSVLDRDKFNAIPEIVKSDLTILRHLGKGSFSDVFEVVCDGPLGDEAGDQQCVHRSTDALGGGLGGQSSHTDADDPKRRRASRRADPLSSSFSSRTTIKPSQLGEPRRILAMKCLRPAIRSDADQFTIGSEDLVHETAILANLSHRNVIQLHGRAAGHLTDTFLLNDGYFVLLDRLHETLTDRLDEWREADGVAKGPSAKQLQVACEVADAMLYLHSKKIIFRDLKPANVGFDSQGVMKLFDFGFASGLPEPEEGNPEGLLFDRAGTPRYMAPEVGLSHGYGLPSDVYSFGILLWEICALAKPFAAIKSADDFDRKVFVGGERPAVAGHWPKAARGLMSRCWAAHPGMRPSMPVVRSSLAATAGGDGGGDKKKSAMNKFRKSLSKKFSMS